MTFDPVRRAADLPDAAAFEHATLDHLARAVGFDAAFFAALDGPPTTRAIDAGRWRTRAMPGGGGGSKHPTDRPTPSSRGRARGQRAASTSRKRLRSKRIHAGSTTAAPSSPNTRSS